MQTKTYKINELQFKKLKQNFFSFLRKETSKSEYELLRGKIDNSTIIVYKNKKQNLSLVIQNSNPEILRIIEKILHQEKRVIEIDDSGWGDLVGGVFIVGRDLKSGEFSAKEISVKYFQGKKFKDGDYYKEAVKKVSKILKELKANPKDTFIKICSGTIFSEVYKFLEEINYEYKIEKITGETQKVAEEIFLNKLKKINCPRGYSQMKCWLKKNPKERMEYVKWI